MFSYGLVFASFIIYLILLNPIRKDYRSLLKNSLLCYFYWLGVWLLVGSVVFTTNFAFFGELFSSLEQQLEWVPILRAPLVEESSKLIFIYILREKQKVSGNELVRLGGIIGNWYFLMENIGYIFVKNLSWGTTIFRLFPGHINYASLDAFGLKNDFSKNRIVFPVLAVLLHGFVNFLSIDYFQLYVISGILSFILFFTILIKTSAHVGK